MIAVVTVAAALTVSACKGQDPASESPRQTATPAASDSPANDLQGKRDDDTAKLDKRVADLERRLTEMQGKIIEKSATPTAGLKAEVEEDVKNAREAVG